MTTNKKIVFVGGNIYPYKVGGYEIFNYYFFQELRKFYSVYQLSHYKKPDYINVNEYSQIRNIKPLSIFSPILLLFRILKNHRKDILILTFAKSRWFNWWPYPLLNILFGTKYIIIIHGGGLMKWGWEYPFQLFFKRATSIVGISKRICDEYQKRTGLSLKFAPPLIPFEKYDGYKAEAREKWNIDGKDIVCLIVGSIKPLKNPNTVLDAAIQLGKEYLLNKKMKFVFVGDGPLRKNLQLIVDSEALQDYFLFLGNIERKDIPSLYAAADIYIMSSDFEGTPLSLLEAMYNKLNIVASNASGINTIIVNGVNGHLFEIGNSIQLAEKLEFLISNGLQTDIREKAKQTYIERYDYNKMISKYKEMFLAL